MTPADTNPLREALVKLKAMTPKDFAVYHRQVDLAISLASEPVAGTVDDRKSWVVIRDPGCMPDLKGPFLDSQIADFLREVFKHRQQSFVEVVTVHDSSIDVQDGPEALEVIDGRSAPVARAHRKRLSAPAPAGRDPFTAEDAWHDLIEKDDRNSPEDYPDMALITSEELADYINRAVEASAVPPHAGATTDSAPGPAWQYAKVSIDVSTCDEDAGMRVFGRVVDWQPDDDQGAIRLLCEYESDNFAMRARTPPGWQAIETAPTSPDRDPPLVLLWVEDGGPAGATGTHAFGRCYKSHDGTTRGVASGFSGNWKISHWMPLPDAPANTGETDRG